MKELLKYVLVFLGSIFVLLGLVGIVVPLIPTTPFLLLGAFCYARSSEKLYHWLLNTKWLGEYIRSFQAGNGIPTRTKIIAIAVLWLTSGYSILFLIPLILVKVLLIGVVSYITYFIWSIKSKVENKEN
jgi:uncharacterized membrane protein YbaN (DUF454 family)